MSIEEASLARDIAAGGEQARRALGIVFDVFAPRLVARLRRKYPSHRELALDAVQQVFLKFLDTISRHELLIGNLDAYLWQSANNSMVDALRVKGRSVEEPLDTLAEDPTLPGSGPNPHPPGPAQLCVQRALARFESALPLHCEALDRLVRGYDYAEIAGWLHRTEHAARQFVYEARKKLEAILIAECGEEYARRFVPRISG